MSIALWRSLERRSEETGRSAKKHATESLGRQSPFLNNETPRKINKETLRNGMALKLLQIGVKMKHATVCICSNVRFALETLQRFTETDLEILNKAQN